jgi:hypothetical protein
MHTPAQAILWQIFWRSRWGFASAGAFLLVAIALSHLLPTHWTVRLGDDEVPAVGWFVGMSCLFANVMLIPAFSMSGVDARNFTFAGHMLILPMRTSGLVAWPLVSGCLIVAAFWVVNASFVFRPTGFAAPLWWPAAALALFLATFQALAWTPFAQRWLHGVVSVAVLMAMFLVPLLVVLLGEFVGVPLTEFAASTLLFALIPIAYVAAHSGVARARGGDFYDWRAWGRFTERFARWRPAASHRFRSMSRAQLWYECRAHMIVPVFIACMLPCFLFVPALEPHNVALGWRLLGTLLGAPVLIGMLGGGTLGHLVDPLSKEASSTFVLVRPISTLTIIRGKLVVAAIMTAAIWVLFLGYISLLLLRPGLTQSIERAASSVPTWKAIAYPLLVLSLLVLFSWMSMIESLWISLTGRKWVEVANGVGMAGLIFVSVGIALWIVVHPQLEATALAAVPWIMGLLLAIKFAVSAWLLYGLVHSRVISVGGAAMMTATWLAVALSLCALAVALLPPELAPATKVIPGIALLVPFARLVGAPLALQWNRHR